MKKTVFRKNVVIRIFLSVLLLTAVADTAYGGPSPAKRWKDRGMLAADRLKDASGEASRLEMMLEAAYVLHATSPGAVQSGEGDFELYKPVIRREEGELFVLS